MINIFDLSKELYMFHTDLEELIKDKGFEYENVKGDMFISEKVADDIKKFLNEEKKEEKEVEKKAEIEKEMKLTKILITSGFNFDGYKIVKYSGYISGDATAEIDRGTAFIGVGVGTNTNTRLEISLQEIRRRAILELKEMADSLGCNAVIGVDFDYITLEPETASLTGKTVYLPYVICVTANGNAVVIEKV